jgi:hypothetical protein
VFAVGMGFGAEGRGGPGLRDADVCSAQRGRSGGRFGKPPIAAITTASVNPPNPVSACVYRYVYSIHFGTWECMGHDRREAVNMKEAMIGVIRGVFFIDGIGGSTATVDAGGLCTNESNVHSTCEY